jgi:hypothetical protein
MRLAERATKLAVIAADTAIEALWHASTENFTTFDQSLGIVPDGRAHA